MTFKAFGMYAMTAVGHSANAAEHRLSIFTTLLASLNDTSHESRDSVPITRPVLLYHAQSGGYVRSQANVHLPLKFRVRQMRHGGWESS